ncbi:MAG: hypothetical protein JWO10_2320 [Microbacteriaceae bacterium]|nr:hypothetical protein [Microbacteriaceae bacterium]
MGERNRAYEKFLGAGEGTDRMQFFSDAVFAIAMTLLVIDITVPTITIHTDAVLWQALGDEWEKFFAYALSFWVIGLQWSTHHRRFRLIKRFNARLISINLLLLLLVAFLPFPTSLISQYGTLAPSVILYAGTVSGLGFMQLAIWIYAYRRGLTDKSVTPGLFHYSIRTELVTPVVFLLSIPVAIIWGDAWPLYFWILSLPLSIIVNRWEPKERAGGN